jgi:hypothetical protein
VPGKYSDYIVVVDYEDLSPYGAGSTDLLKYPAVQIKRYDTGGTYTIGYLMSGSQAKYGDQDGAEAFTWSALANFEVAINVPIGSFVTIKDMYLEIKSSLDDKLPDTTKTVQLRASWTEHIKGVVDGGVVPTYKNVYHPAIVLSKTIVGLRPDNSNFYSTFKGPFYTTEMLRSTGYTETDCVRNPVSVIEYLLRYKANVPVSRINTDSFDNLSNVVNGKRKDWYCDLFINEQKEVFEHIADICQQFQMYFVIKQGQYYLYTSDQDSIYTLTSADISSQGGLSQIQIQQSDASSILNDIDIQYRPDTKSGTAQSNMYISDVFSNNDWTTNMIDITGAPNGGDYVSWSTGSFDLYKIRGTLKPDMPYIRNDNTAELSLKSLLDWNAYKRILLNIMVLKNTSTLSLSVGDIIKVRDDSLGDHSDSTKFLITGLTWPAYNFSSQPFFTLKCVSVPGTNYDKTVALNSSVVSDTDLVDGP